MLMILTVLVFFLLVIQVEGVWYMLTKLRRPGEGGLAIADIGKGERASLDPSI